MDNLPLKKVIKTLHLNIYKMLRFLTNNQQIGATTGLNSAGTRKTYW